MKGTYLFNQKIDFSQISSTGDYISKIPFLSKNTRFDSLDIDVSSEVIRYNNLDVYTSKGWTNEKYRTITFFEEQEDEEWSPNKETIKDWIANNSTKIKAKGKIKLIKPKLDETSNEEEPIFPVTYITQIKNEDGTQWIPSLGGSGGMGGGGGGAVSITTITEPELTTSLGVKTELEFEWSSEADGSGTLYIYVDGELKKTTLAKQGKVKVDISSYITSATEYLVRLVVEDSFGSKRALNYQVTAISLIINSTFDQTQAYTGEIIYRYTPYGDVKKTIHLFVDGVEYTQEVEPSGREQTFNLPTTLSHGVHTLKVYATATFGETTVYSNELNYKFAYYQEGNSKPIIVIFNNANETFEEGQTVKINYLVYTATSETTDITLYLNGQSQNLTVDRNPKVWSITDYSVGINILTIAITDLDISNPINKTLTFNVVASEITITPVTTGLQLFLSSSNKSNNVSSKNEWTYGDIKTTFNNFNFVSDGWLEDSNRIIGLKMTGDANIEIGYKPFGDDAKVNGKTIELEFATSNVTNFDTTVINIMSGNRGLLIKPNEIIFKSLGKEINTRFKQDEHIRVALVIERSTSNKFISTYINGVLSGIDVYGDSDDFEQTSPVNIKAGSTECDLTLYKIRVYNNDLTAVNILDNYISDNDNYDLKTKLYRRNQIYDAYGNVLYNKVKNIMPVLLITAPILPSAKDEVQKLTSLKLENINNPQLNWEYNNLEFEIQGTSSVQYPVKNLEFKFGEDIIQLYPDAIPENRLTLKVDYASSAGVFNMGNAKIVNGIYQEKNPRQEEDGRVRNALYGYPVAVFYRKASSDNWQFHCKGSLNLSKKAKAMGYKEGDESWEVKNNTSPLCLFDSNDFSTLSSDFEYRYNKGGSSANLETLISWVYSCKGNPPKFRSECEEHFNLHYLLMYYVYGQIMGGADSYAKNLYLGFFAEGQNEDGTYYGKWYPEFYDLDTSYGIDNTGRLKFEYSTELNDKVEDRYAFNGHDSVLWNLVQEAYADELKTLYQTLRNGEYVTYDSIMSVLQEQGIEQYPEAIYNEDANIKYITPYLEDGENYLSTALGSTLEHLKYWVNNRLKYLDSKWIASEYSLDRIVTRITTPDDVTPDYSITLKSRNDMYMQIQYGSYYAKQRATRNIQYTLTPDIPTGTVFNDTEAYIYGASSLTSVGDLSKWYVTLLDISKATSLTEIKVGDSSANYSNDNLKEFTAGANTLLRKIDLTNCTGLTGDIDLSQCASLQELYATGTQITSFKFANGGQLKLAYLPETITTLELINLVSIQTLATTGEYSRIRIENSNVDTLAYVQSSISAGKLERLRLIGIDWTIGSKDLLDYLIANVKGINSIGNNQDKSVLSGKIHILGEIYSDEIEAYRTYWGTSLTITSDNLIRRYTCRFFSYDGTLLYQTVVLHGDSVAYVGEIPTKPLDEVNEVGYLFSGWDKSQNDITSDTDFYPTFIERPMVLTTFVDYAGNVLYTNKVVSGTLPIYVGETPTKPTDYELQKRYEFKEWSPSINTAVTSDTVFTPVFVSVDIYKVEWVNYNNVVLSTEYYEKNQYATYKGETPTRETDTQYIYTFSGWSPNPENLKITRNTKFVAGYSLKKLCKVTLLNADGTTFYEVGLGEGEQFNYSETPTPPEDDVQYKDYQFANWQLNGSNITLPITVSSNVTLTPVFKGTLRKYSVFWYVNGELMETDVGVAYGTVGVSYDGVTPESPNENWVFKGWNIDQNSDETIDINSYQVVGDTYLYAIFQDPYSSFTKVYYKRYSTSTRLLISQMYNVNEEIPNDSLFVDWGDGNGYIEYKEHSTVFPLHHNNTNFLGDYFYQKKARAFSVYAPSDFSGSTTNMRVVKIKYFKDQIFVYNTYWSANPIENFEKVEFSPLVEVLTANVYRPLAMNVDQIVFPTNLKYLGGSIFRELKNQTISLPSSLECIDNYFTSNGNSGNMLFGENNKIKWNCTKAEALLKINGSEHNNAFKNVIEHICTDGTMNKDDDGVIEIDCKDKYIGNFAVEFNYKFKLKNLTKIYQPLFTKGNILSINSDEDYVYDLSDVNLFTVDCNAAKASGYQFEKDGQIINGLKKVISPKACVYNYRSDSNALTTYTVPFSAEEIYISKTLEEYKNSTNDSSVPNSSLQHNAFGGYRVRTYFNNELFICEDSITLETTGEKHTKFIIGLDYSNVVQTKQSWDDKGTFTYMTNLRTVTLGNFSSLYARAFAYSGIESYQVPATVSSLGEGLFQDAYNLHTIDLTLCSSTKIPANFAYNCKKLSTILLNSNITEIGYNCFYNCVRLKQFEIPTAVASIASKSFYDEEPVVGKTIIFKNIIPPSLHNLALNSEVFNATNSCKIVVPAESYLEYKKATNYVTFSDIIYPDRAWVEEKQASLEFNSYKEINLNYAGFTEIPQVTATVSDVSVCSVNNINVTDNNISFIVNSLTTEGTSNIKLTLKTSETTLESNVTIRVYEQIPGPTISVESVEGATYGFALNENGYYESTNQGISNSYSICKINIVAASPIILNFECINSGESYADFGIISSLNKTLTLSNSTDSSNVAKSFYGQSSTNVVNYDYGEIPVGTSFIYVKYRKDSSVNQGNDSFQFKINYEMLN